MRVIGGYICNKVQKFKKSIAVKIMSVPNPTALFHISHSGIYDQLPQNGYTVADDSVGVGVGVMVMDTQRLYIQQPQLRHMIYGGRLEG